MALDVFIYPASFKLRRYCQKAEAETEAERKRLLLDLNLLLRLALIYLFHSNLSIREHLNLKLVFQSVESWRESGYYL